MLLYKNPTNKFSNKIGDGVGKAFTRIVVQMTAGMVCATGLKVYLSSRDADTERLEANGTRRSAVAQQLH